MLLTIVRFLNIFLAALVAGTIFGIWLGYDPHTLSASTYVEQQQNTIRALNVLMPLLGFITILVTALSAYLQRAQKAILLTLLMAAVLLIASGLITRFGNQPINSIVMTWNASSPPVNWTQLRDQWWFLHMLRTFFSVVALCLIIAASIKRN
ncbi:DUF1772 domain-containing protein [Rhodocytophaga rosea]|uniref:DUF1772 domain-containing protein n=1 Tax=Rhodocytophaga rosea TaxID=2704465 RepID=A0A6C0GTY7_9BACT|nr:DUF1772 domain-containing protein [Rhodocytophaga rosea]QHT71649.1 DUF1772 domain-containing protein [Rhodocytophaga rosea]